MSWWDYAYNPYKIPEVRNWVRPYVRQGLKSLGVKGDYSNMLIDYSNKFNDLKTTTAKNLLRRVMRRKAARDTGVKRKLDFDDDPEDKKKPRHRSSFRNLSNSMMFSYQRRPRRVKFKDPFAKYGVVSIVKASALSSAAQETAATAGLQHGAKVDFGHHVTPTLDLLYSTFKCLIRMLSVRNGVAMPSWDRLASKHFIVAPAATHAIAICYIDGPGDVRKYVSINLDNESEKMGELGVRLFNGWETRVKLTTSPPDRVQNRTLSLMYIDYYELADPKRSVARINLTDAYIDVRCYSTLKIQNRTLGDDSTATETTDITNNPIMLRVMDVRGDGVVRNVMDEESGIVGTANGLTGFYTSWAKELGYNDINPDPRDYKAVLGASRKIMKPGDFHTSTLKYTRKMKLDTFLHLFHQYILLQTVGVSGVRVPFGVSRVFMADKYLHSGQGNQRVTCGLELRACTKVRIYSKNPRVRGIMTHRGLITDANPQGLEVV